MLCINAQKEYVDEFVQGGYLGCIIGAIMLIGGIWQKSVLDTRPFNIAQQNGDKPSTLFSFLGIGQRMFGAFKYREIEGTHVSYTFFCFILPLFPTGCYRVRLLSEGIRTQEWTIYGSERINSLEILNIYLQFYGLLIWVLCLIFSIMHMI